MINFCMTTSMSYKYSLSVYLAVVLSDESRHDSPDDELHLAPTSCVHQDGNQLRVPRAKDTVRPNSNSEETLLLVTCLEDQLKTERQIPIKICIPQQQMLHLFSSLSACDCQGQHGKRMAYMYRK